MLKSNIINQVQNLKCKTIHGKLILLSSDETAFKVFSKNSNFDFHKIKLKRKKKKHNDKERTRVKRKASIMGKFTRISLK